LLQIIHWIHPWWSFGILNLWDQMSDVVVVVVSVSDVVGDHGIEIEIEIEIVIVSANVIVIVNVSVSVMVSVVVMVMVSPGGDRGHGLVVDQYVMMMYLLSVAEHDVWVTSYLIVIYELSGSLRIVYLQILVLIY
jgi:hypothetical protein